MYLHCRSFGVLKTFAPGGQLTVLPIKAIAVLLKGTYCQVLVLVLKNLTFSSSICSYLSYCKFWKDKPVKQENKNIFATCWLVSFSGIVTESCLISSKVKNCLSVSSSLILSTLSQGCLEIILSLTASFKANRTLPKCPDAVLGVILFNKYF